MLDILTQPMIVLSFLPLARRRFNQTQRNILMTGLKSCAAMDLRNQTEVYYERKFPYF
ncbi:hypothetical protein GGE09_000674 [Roseobacter sp. N2S]|nr:hypothetical protein [Roseobacter sp. N2S]